MIKKGDREITCFGKKSWQLVSGRCKFQTQMLLLCNMLVFHIKRLLCMRVSFCFSLRSFLYEMSSELRFSCGLVHTQAETGLTPTENRVHCPGQKAAWITGKKMLLYETILTVATMVHIQQRAGPASYHQPERCLQFLLPVIEDMCYSANSTDGKCLIVLPLWSLGNEREKAGVGGRQEAEHFHFLMLTTLSD